MEIVHVRNVNGAYLGGLALLRAKGVRETSRAGDVLVMPCPVTTCYERPQERVLLDAHRDANPFLHLFESLWMLAGRNDATWLDRFVKDFSSRFAEEGGRQHGAYGYRWRHHFDVEGGGHPALPDQLGEVVRLLKANPHDRRVVLTMWDPVADLGVHKSDIPCNTHAYLRVRYAETDQGQWRDVPHWKYVLDLTVCCRSNDAIWGAYGANAVHFSMLQEYLAGMIGVGVGRYFQVSNNFHAYVNVLDKVGVPLGGDPYNEEGDQGILRPTPIGADWDHWDDDLTEFMAWVDAGGIEGGRIPEFCNSWFYETAAPLLIAHSIWRMGGCVDALAIVNNRTFHGAMAEDWRLAARQWFERRLK
jgi:thymidylate synthase